LVFFISSETNTAILSKSTYDRHFGLRSPVFGHFSLLPEGVLLIQSGIHFRTRNSKYLYSMKNHILLLLTLITCINLHCTKQKANLTGDMLNNYYFLEVGMSRYAMNLNKENTGLIKKLEQRSRVSPEKVKPSYDKALQAEIATGTFTQFVQELMDEMELHAGGRQSNGWLVGADDLEYPYRVFLKEGKGQELQQKINGLRITLAGLIDSADRQDLENRFIPEVEAGTEETWVHSNFKDLPVVAVMINLYRMKNNAKHTESEVLKMLELSTRSSHGDEGLFRLPPADR
jgi:hypothetical protein